MSSTDEQRGFPVAGGGLFKRLVRWLRDRHLVHTWEPWRDVTVHMASDIFGKWDETKQTRCCVMCGLRAIRRL